MYLSTSLARLCSGLLSIVLIAGISNASAAVSTFEDVSMPNEQSYAGPGGGNYWSGLVPPTNGSINSSFTSGSVAFHNTNNECCGGATFFSGFAYSSTSDTNSSDFTNQYSAYVGSGANGSESYGLAYNQNSMATLNTAAIVSGAYFTNTTYAALSMLNGDSFSKKFGGDDGNDADFFNLVITGLDSNNDETGTVTFALADYTFADNSQDYIVDTWEWVDLSSLGLVSGLSFSFESSDVGTFGINTPVYFAIDDLTTVPVPAGIWLMLSAMAAVLRISQKK